MANKKLKDKKIKIYKYVETTDEDGFQTAGYMPIHPQESLWAYFKQLSAELTYLNNSTQSKEECFFAVNWLEILQTPIAKDLHIEYNGYLYQVTRIDSYEGYKRDLFLYARYEAKAKNLTILPYDPEKLAETN